MTDGTPGWFRDPSDPTIARWHDGEKWTDHTLVIADQTPGEEPPPPDLTDTGFAPADPDFRVRSGAGLAGLPTWAKVGGPIAVVILLIVGVLLATGGGDSNDKASTSDTRAATLDAAVDTAREKGLDSSVSDARASALITRICSAASNPSAVDQLGADLAQLPAASTDDVRTNVKALGAGATKYCRSKISDNPDLISNLEDQAAIAFTTTTTSPTVAGTDGGTDSGATAGTSGDTSGTTTKGKTTTTVKGKTATTKAPTTTTTKPLPVQKEGFPCSSPGAKAQTRSGVPISCQPTCGPKSYTWARGESPCATTTTLPPTPTSTPTIPSGTTGGTTGGTDSPTTGGPTTGGTT
jgi:hypothetical protein